MTRKADQERSRSRIRKTETRKLLEIDFGGLGILDHAEVVNLSAVFRRTPVTSRVVINLDGVMSLPSGFFGMLLDGVELGLRVRVENASPAIQVLTGFQKFINKRGDVHL